MRYYVLSDKNDTKMFIKCFSDDMTCAYWTPDINKAMVFSEDGIHGFEEHPSFNVLQVLRATQII